MGLVHGTLGPQLKTVHERRRPMTISCAFLRGDTTTWCAPPGGSGVEPDTVCVAAVVWCAVWPPKFGALCRAGSGVEPGIAAGAALRGVRCRENDAEWVRCSCDGRRRGSSRGLKAPPTGRRPGAPPARVPPETALGLALSAGPDKSRGNKCARASPRDSGHTTSADLSHPPPREARLRPNTQLALAACTV